MQKMSEEAAAMKAPGPRFSRRDRMDSKTPKSTLNNPVKQETKL
jgi:hypothetical protein